MIDDAFIRASDHRYSCRCPQCLHWWVLMGKDPDTERYGPFTEAEIEKGRALKPLPGSEE